MNRSLLTLGLALVLIAALGTFPRAGEPPADRAAFAQGGLPSLPPGWPSTMQLGRSDFPNGATSLRNIAPFGFRYQYLSAGVNTGNGWATWNPDGQFVTYYIQESRAAGITPVFTYYMIYQSLPAVGSGEQEKVLNNLRNTATMQAYWADLRLFFQRAGAFPDTRVVLHVEPDLWGYVQQRAAGDNAATVEAKVGSTGVPEVAGLPDTVVGLANGIVRMRDQHAPNVQLAYAVSVWGTNVDISIGDPSDAEVDALGSRAAAFYRSLQASFDLAFGELSDRDSEFKRIQWGAGPEAWWTPDDFTRHIRFISRFVAETGRRMVLWQIPLGNTRMRAMNNSWNHYQDNRVETLLDDPARTRLNQYANAGVIGFLFGRGADGATDATDASGDGVTNPSPINGNDRVSVSAGDDGGFFHERAQAYYQAGALPLPGATGAPPPTSGPTATPTQPTTASFQTSATVSPGVVGAGSLASIAASVTSATAATALVDVEVYAPSGAKIHQQWFDNEVLAAGQARAYAVSWSVPNDAALGAYTVKIGVFRVAWGVLYAWNDAATTFEVAPPVSCSPRPPVSVQAVPSGGQLQVVVGVSGQHNRLLSLRFAETRNALVDIGGTSGRTGSFTIVAPTGSTTSAFAVRRAGAGPATVSLTVTDRCGEWPTLVGGGAGAF